MLRGSGIPISCKKNKKKKYYPLVCFTLVKSLSAEFGNRSHPLQFQKLVNNRYLVLYSFLHNDNYAESKVVRLLEASHPVSCLQLWQISAVWTLFFLSLTSLPENFTNSWGLKRGTNLTRWGFEKITLRTCLLKTL